MRQGPPVCLHNRPIDGPCRDCDHENGCNAGNPCPHPNLQPFAAKETSPVTTIKETR